MATDHLAYVSKLAKELGVTDPVDTYLTPLVGRWQDLHDEATRWRTAAKAAEDTTHRLTRPLGGLDDAWQGQDANSFLDYMQNVGLAGNDLSEAMTAMADALDKTADGIAHVVQEMIDLITDAADHSSDALTMPGSGRARAKRYLAELEEPTNKLYEAARDVLRAFTKLCEGVQGVQTGQSRSIAMSHRMPPNNWTPAPQPKPAPTPKPVPQSPPAPVHPAPAAPVARPTSAPAHTATLAAHVTQPTDGAVGGGAAAAHVPPPTSAPPRLSGPPTVSGAVVADPTTGSISGQLPVSGGGTGNPDGSAADATGMPMGGMGMGGAKGGGDQQHKAKTRVRGDVREVFGEPDRTAPPTIGER